MNRIPDVDVDAIVARRKRNNLFILIGATTAMLSIITISFLFQTSHSNDSMLLGTLSKVVPFESVIHPEAPTSYWGNVVKPYPTGAFWTNLVVHNGDGAIGLYPYGIKTVDSGVQVSYGAFRRQVSRTAITDLFTVDLELSAVEQYQSRSVATYDNISVTMTYITGLNGATYSTHLVKCSPFVTVVYSGATPVIRSPLMHILKVEARPATNSTGSQFMVTLGNFERWLVFSSVPVTPLLADDALSFPGPIAGFVRVAVLPVQRPEESFDTLMQYVHKYPVGATTSISYAAQTATTATIAFSFKTVGSGPLLMLAAPHQIPLFQLPAINNEEHKHLLAVYSPIYSIKGRLTPIVGDCWRLTYILSQVGWTYTVTETIPSSKMDLIAANLILDVNTILPTATDPYTFGKQVARMATIALTADELGIADVRQTALTNLETAFGPWLAGSNVDALLYDRTYGGLVSRNGLADQFDDFGAGWYSDHHFHFGYFVYAAAVLAKLDPVFFGSSRTVFDAIVADICNGNSSDDSFPVARHKDFFDGHSWASGLFQQSNGKGQESSSEAVNAYYGVYLYGMVTANADLMHFAQLLLTMEIQAAQVYWHANDASIYDNLFAASSRMVGNIGALDVTASTWFGDDVRFVHGINMMPLTPASSNLFDPQYVAVQYPVLASSLPTATSQPSPQCEKNPKCMALGLSGMCCPTPDGQELGCCEGSGSNPLQDEFVSYIYADQAVVSRETAWKKILAQSSFGNGNSKSNSLFWAATRAPPVPGFNTSARVAPPVPPQACSLNSACDVLGIPGNCCPTDAGVQLGCCPVASAVSRI